jgi:hypothetical protein
MRHLRLASAAAAALALGAAGPSVAHPMEGPLRLEREPDPPAWVLDLYREEQAR